MYPSILYLLLRMLKYLVLNLVFPLIELLEECFWDYTVATFVKVLWPLRSFDIIVIPTGMRMRTLVMNCIHMHVFIWRRGVSYDIGCINWLCRIWCVVCITNWTVPAWSVSRPQDEQRVPLWITMQITYSTYTFSYPQLQIVQLDK